MTLCEELYFDIKFSGKKGDIDRVVKYLKSGVLDDFFDVSSEYFVYADDYDSLSGDEDTEIEFTNDDNTVYIEEVEAEAIAETICSGAAPLFVSGTMYDINDDDFSFYSEKSDAGYINRGKEIKYNEDEFFDE